MLKKSKARVEQERYNYSFSPEVRVMIVATLVIALSLVFTDVKLWGVKTEALFDVWFLQHLFSGIILCYGTIANRGILKYPLFVAILMAYAWEGLEYWLEIKSHEVIMLWFAGLEHPLNKFVIDPLAAAIGFALVKKFPDLIYPALILAFFFLLIHLWLGDSMAIQKLLL